MRDYLANEIRNIVLLGHSGCGKTTLAESILYFTKATDRFGKITEGNTTLDYDAEEIKRKFSINLAIAPIEWKDCKINFIDTPGYFDFVGEMNQGVGVADNALIVVGAKEGVEVGTENAFKLASEKKLPTIFFVNKLDEENVSFEKCFNQLREKFGKTIIAFELPIIEAGKIVGIVNVLQNKAYCFKGNLGQECPIPSVMLPQVEEHRNEIAEAIAMTNDELMDKYFSGETFTDEELTTGMQLGVRSGEIRPVFCGAAATMDGVDRLMDLIIKYFPSYEEKGTIVASDPNGDLVELKTNEQESMSCLVFKTIIDPFVGKITYLKVLSGVLTSDCSVYNPNKDKIEKIGSVYLIKGKQQLAAGKLFTGDIGAVVKLTFTDTNDTLCDRNKPVIHDKIKFPTPLLGYAIWPKSKNDEDKLSGGLKRIAEEDTTFKVVNNLETRENVIYGMGEQHLDVIVSRLKSKYRVEVDLTTPVVPYRESIRKVVTVEGRHKKQSGGHGQFGHVFIRFEPADTDEMIFDQEIFGGSVPKNYWPAVETGLRECMNKGALAGYKVVGVKAVLTDGKYHDVDSNEMSFKLAARLAFKAAMKIAGTYLLEPIVNVEVTVPEDYTGAIIGDFNKRRGSIMGMEFTEDGWQVVSAQVPMAEMLKYTTELRSMTQGRGSYTMSFDRYDAAPSNVAERVISERKKSLEEDED